MGSNQSTTSSSSSDPLPGYSSIKIHSSDKNLIEETNDSNASGSSSYSSNSGGLRNGEEGFNTVSEKTILDDPDDETVKKVGFEEDHVDPFVGCSGFSVPIENVVADDAKKGNKVGVLEGEKVQDKVIIGGEGLSAENLSCTTHQLAEKLVSNEVVETAEEVEGKKLFDSTAIKAILAVAEGAKSEGGSITITSQDESKLFSVERPAGLGSSVRSSRLAPRAKRSDFRSPCSFAGGEEFVHKLSGEEKRKLEILQTSRVKFLRLVKRLGLSLDDSSATQVLYKLAIFAGIETGAFLGLDYAKQTALQLEEDGKADLDLCLNILVLGKSGVGKSATINAIFGEEKTQMDAFQPATTAVKELTGVADGVKIRIFDIPGLKSSVMEQSFNRNVLSSVKKFTKKHPIDIVLYVDRLDAQTRDLNDIPLLRTIINSLGPSIWKSAIVTLTHAASAPPEGPSGSPLTYDGFITLRTHVLQQSIRQAIGTLAMMSQSLMTPVCLVENHPSCRKNREGHKVLPNGQIWKPQLMIMCYSMKILSEAKSLFKPQDPFNYHKLYGLHSFMPSLSHVLSSMLQPRTHPKLSSEQSGNIGDIDWSDLSGSDQEEHEDEYDQLPPFKPLRKSELAKLTKEQKKAYFEEYDYRVMLFQKMQRRQELKRMREMKKKGKDAATEYGYMDDDPDAGPAASESVPSPDMPLPASFDSDNPAHRYRLLDRTSNFVARAVLDNHGWDHDFGFDGVSLAYIADIVNKYPGAISAHFTKDKDEFFINLDSSIAAKHGESGSSMAGFDIQSAGNQQLVYTIRGETKFKNLNNNKTAVGVSTTFLGDNVVTGVTVEDQIAFGKQYSLVGNAGMVRCQQDAAYGATIEMQRRELYNPNEKVQSSCSLSIMKWRGDLIVSLVSLAEFSIGRSSKVAVQADMNSKLNGKFSIRTSSSEHLSLALAGIIPAAISIYKKLYPGVGEKYSIY